MANTARALPAIPSGERGPLPGVVSSEGKGEAAASGSFRVPELRLVPPEPEDEKVITELPHEQGINETAAWAREQAKLAEPKEKPATLPELTARLESVLKERRGFEEQLKNLDRPVHKAVEALQAVGFLKDTLQAFGGWKAERARIEETMDSVDLKVQQLDRDINALAKVPEPKMAVQSAEIAKDVTPEDQELIKAWFQNPDAFMDDLDDEVEGMVKNKELTSQEQAAWKSKELPPDARQAIEERVKMLKAENTLLERQREELERRIKESIPRSERKGEKFLVERLAFDKRLRNKFAGEGLRGLFSFGKKKENVFLTLEPELRGAEAQLSINNEAIRRAELTLKDPRQAIMEDTVRAIERFARTRSSSIPERMPGAMSEAA